jgi:hypothetical protein
MVIIIIIQIFYAFCKHIVCSEDNFSVLEGTQKKICIYY